METKQTIDQYIIQMIAKKQPETVHDLVKLVQQSYPSVSEQIITERILYLQKQRKLTLKKHSVQLPYTLKGYLLSEAAWYWAIVVLALATTALIFTVPEDAYPLIYARYLLGSVFVLWLPGYTLIKALFPTKELDNIELIALSIGISLALVPITGLLLNYTPWGIRTTPITLTLLALTLTFATAAIIRENQAQRE